MRISLKLAKKARKQAKIGHIWPFLGQIEAILRVFRAQYLGKAVVKVGPT